MLLRRPLFHPRLCRPRITGPPHVQVAAGVVVTSHAQAVRAPGADGKLRTRGSGSPPSLTPPTHLHRWGGAAAPPSFPSAAVPPEDHGASTRSGRGRRGGDFTRTGRPRSRRGREISDPRQRVPTHTATTHTATSIIPSCIKQKKRGWSRLQPRLMGLSLKSGQFLTRAKISLSVGPGVQMYEPPVAPGTGA